VTAITTTSVTRHARSPASRYGLRPTLQL
jgi:hypothetical protein